MAKTKKATPSPVDEKVYDGSFTYKDLDGKEVKVKYKGCISLQDMGSCIHSIVNNVVDDEFGYFPYLYDISFSSNLLEYFTDFDTNIGTEKLVEILNKTNLQDELDKCISAYQFETILTSVSEMIEFKKQKLATKSEIDSTFTGLLNDFRSLLAKANNFLDLDPDVLGKVVNNLAGMEGISQKDLIDAIVDKASVTKGKGGRPKGNSKGKGNNKVVPFPEPELNGQIDIDGNVTEVEDK